MGQMLLKKASSPPASQPAFFLGGLKRRPTTCYALLATHLALCTYLEPAREPARLLLGGLEEAADYLLLTTYYSLGTSYLP